jgi:hypothetical protein
MHSTSFMTDPSQHQSSHSESMDYTAMFDSMNPELTFNSQTSPGSSADLDLEGLVLSESPPGHFNTQSQRNSPPFGNSGLNFSSGMPIETMLDMTPTGQPSYISSTMVTEQTARLMRHYIDNLASWMDLSDSRTHFSTVVPKRALTSVFPCGRSE